MSHWCKDATGAAHVLRPACLAAEAPPEPWRVRLLIFLGYLALGVIFTWPLILHLTDGVIQKGSIPVDAGQGIWNLWWARTTLLLGQNPFTTDYLFYPFQINLFFQTLSLPNALLAAPALIAVGPVVAFNLVALLSFSLGGYFAYRVAYAAVHDRAAALLAGFIFAFSPYHMQRLWSGPMELIAIHWLPLYVLLLMRALARPGILRLLAAALALLVTTLASQYYGLYAVVYTAGHGLLATMIAPHNARLRTFRAVAAVGVFWVLGLVPIILAVGGVDAAVLEDWYVRQVFHSVSLIDLIAPNIQHPIWGPTATAWLQGLHPFGLETGAGVGLVIIILSLLALARRPRQSWPWAILAFGTLLLAMGPQLRLTTADSPVPGPFLLLDLIGPFRNSSRPSVFLALTMIALAVLAAEGFASLHDFRPARWTMAVLLIAELSVAPWPITSISAAPVYHLLNADPIPGAVFDLPPRNNDSVNLLKQICHGRPIIGGYLARLPDYALSSYPSAFKGLWDAAAPAGDMLELNPAAELATLGIRYVTLDLTHLNRNEEQHLRARLAVRGIRRSYADDQLEIYMVNPAAAHTVAVLGPGWYDVERNAQLYWRWMQNHATLSLIAPTRSVVKLHFTATAYAQGRPLKIWLGDQLLASVEIPAAPYDHTVSLQLILPPGQTDLVLESPAVKSPEGRLLSLSVTGLTVTSVPTVLGYASQQLLAIPPTLPTLVAPPCSH